MKNAAKKWQVSDITHAEYLGVLEFQDNAGEFHVFEVLETPGRIVFGGMCNAGFLESGYLAKEEDETTDEALRETIADLEVYYDDGPKYVSRIVCNKRM